MPDASSLTLRDTAAAADALLRERLMSEFDCTEAQLLPRLAQEVERLREVAQSCHRQWRRLAALKRRAGYEIPADMLPPRRRGRIR